VTSRIERLVALSKFVAAALIDYRTRVAWTKTALSVPGVPESYRKNIVKVLDMQLLKLQEVLQEMAKHVDAESEELEDLVGLAKKD